eukprot:maker-scaffold_4-snap-gene-4.37-mRNA-1 protein AED:0.05 eAED:0.07 QI:0/0/0/1/1/1/6/0/982
MKVVLYLLLLLFFHSPSVILAVDKSKFKTCQQSPFCANNRKRTSFHQYIEPNSVQVDANEVTGDLFITDEDESSKKKLIFSLYLTKSKAIRFRLKEIDDKRYKTHGVLLEQNLEKKYFTVKSQTKKTLELYFQDGDLGEYILLNFDPFLLQVKTGDEILFELNHFKQLYFNSETSIYSSDKSIEAAAGTDDEKEIVSWGEDGKPIYADGTVGDAPKETKKDAESSQKDESIGFDALFPSSIGFFGLPEHATNFRLPDTISGSGIISDPYRLYTLDVFEYELDSPMALYGANPTMVSVSSQGTATGLFFNNPSDTFVDTSTEGNGKKVRWMAETSSFDLFIVPGGDLSSVLYGIKELVGPTLLPPLFSLGYHQCRWNYNDEQDFLTINEKFDEFELPCDVIWLDIEHTDGKRYFTFDKKKFPNPAEMFKKVAASGRKSVVVVDPHVKRDKRYEVHKQLESKGMYIRKSDGKDFDGWCWPGSSSYPDFTSPEVRNFWANLYLENKDKILPDLVHIWNDMNEPSVFNQAEVTTPKDTVNLENRQFKEFHNLYGFYYQATTQAGIMARDMKNDTNNLGSDLMWRNFEYTGEKLCSNANSPEKLTMNRGFVLSRAFFAGTQRFGAIWTGDNDASWAHLRASVPMILSLSVTGIHFVGADVGGFFGDPSPELMVRWIQASSMQPFMRNHAHLESPRREPYIYAPEIREIIKTALWKRYSYVDYLYTVAFRAEKTGDMWMRPLFYHYNQGEPLKKLVEVESQWLYGRDIMVAPVLEEGAQSVTVTIPPDDFFLFLDEDKVALVNSAETSTTRKVTIPVNLETLPIFHRGASIIPRRMRLRRSTAAMKNDPYTIYVSHSQVEQTSTGELYLDDSISFDYVDRNSFALVKFTSISSATSIKFSVAVEFGNADEFSGLPLVDKVVFLLPASRVTAKSLKATVRSELQTQQVSVQQADVSVAELRSVASDVVLLTVKTINFSSVDGLQISLDL